MSPTIISKCKVTVSPKNIQEKNKKNFVTTTL